jgi:predicted membrane-bound dolichyl-phosphate-mannose-protein mannosyltransferase
MKRGLFIGLVLIMSLSGISCNSQVKKDKENIVAEVSGNVEVYYFHYTRRCATCENVEDNTKLAIENINKKRVGGDAIVYHVLNLDDVASKGVADKFKVGGQSLIVTMGEKKVDITGNAFINAKSPVKIEEEISKATNKLLKP